MDGAPNRYKNLYLKDAVSNIQKGKYIAYLKNGGLQKLLRDQRATGKPANPPSIGLKKAEKTIAYAPYGWQIIVEDESFICYESTSRRVWIRKGTKPIRLVTGSHSKLLIFGALTLSKKQTFRTLKIKYKKVMFNWKTTLNFLRLLKRKYRRFILFWDRATPHRDWRVKRYLKANENCIKIMYFPRATPEANPTEECWKQTKGDSEVVANKIYDSFDEFHTAVTGFYKKKRFNLDLRHYLCH